MQYIYIQNVNYIIIRRWPCEREARAVGGQPGYIRWIKHWQLGVDFGDGRGGWE